jgi:phosphatidylglycerophosphate synthase
MTLQLPRSDAIDVAGADKKPAPAGVPRSPIERGAGGSVQYAYARRSPVQPPAELPGNFHAQTRPHFTVNDVRATYKKRDAWWTVFLVDPLAARIIIPLANRTNITPNQVSIASFVIGLAAAAAFWQGDHVALAAGALLYHVSFVLDCIDGKIARLKGTGSVFGMWLDYSFDRYRVLACTAALMFGQYHRTGQNYFIWLAVLVTFLDMLRYMDALQVYKLRLEMSKRLRAAGRPKVKRVLRYVAVADEPVRFIEVGAAQDLGYHKVPTATSPQEAVYARRPGRPKRRAVTYLLQQEFWSRFGWWARVREVLMRKRVRPHLFSGIEYQMCIFIVGPLLNAVLGAVVVSAVLLLVFEAAVIYKLLLSSRDFEREMRRLSGPGDDGRAVTAAATAVGAPEVHDELEFDAPPTEHNSTGGPRYSGTQELEPVH